MNENREFLGSHRLCHLKKMFATWKENSKLSEESCKSHDNQIENFISELSDTDGCRMKSNGTDKWFYVSDSQVTEVNVAKVLKTQAYILFYERIQ